MKILESAFSKIPRLDHCLTDVVKIKKTSGLRSQALFSSMFLLIMMTFTSHSAMAAIIFQDGFNSETGVGGYTPSGSTSRLSITGLTSWDVTDGTIDLLVSGEHQTACFGGSGKCIDLDGSSNNAGVMTLNNAISLAAGDYQLSYKLSGTAGAFTQTAAGNPNNVLAEVLGVGSQIEQTTENIAQGASFTTYFLNFNLSSAADIQIQFAEFGSNTDDNFGAILDDVQLSSVPVPAAVWLLGSALVGLAGFKRKRSA